jgi:hypothetical protein
MTRQGALKLQVSIEKFDSLHDLLVYLVRTNGPPKQVVLAKQLGAQTGHLSEVLNDQGKHWPEEWIKFIAENYDPDDMIPAYVARWKGLTVRPARVVTDAAWRRNSEIVFARHGAVGDELRKEIEVLALAEPETDEATS